MEEQTTSEPAPVNARGQVFGIIFYPINGTSPDHCSFSLFKLPTSKDCASETMCLIFGYCKYYFDLQNTHSILIRDIHSKALCLTQCFVFLDKVCGVALLTFGDLDPQNIVTDYNSTRYH